MKIGDTEVREGQKVVVTATWTGYAMKIGQEEWWLDSNRKGDGYTLVASQDLERFDSMSVEVVSEYHSGDIYRDENGVVYRRLATGGWQIQHPTEGACGFEDDLPESAAYRGNIFDL